MNGNRLYRSMSEAKVGGVAAGLGNYFKVDPTIFRIIFVVATIFTGGSFALAYLALWLFLPTATTKSSDLGGIVRENLDEMGARFRSYANTGNNGNGNSSASGQNANSQASSASGGAPTTPVGDYKTVQEAQQEKPSQGQAQPSGPRHMNLLPLLLILFGIFFLMSSFHPMRWAGPHWGWGFFFPWPLILIVLGLFVLRGRRYR